MKKKVICYCFPHHKYESYIQACGHKNIGWSMKNIKHGQNLNYATMEGHIFINMESFILAADQKHLKGPL